MGKNAIEYRTIYGTERNRMQMEATDETMRFLQKLVDCLEKCLIYGHIRRFAD